MTFWQYLTYSGYIIILHCCRWGKLRGEQQRAEYNLRKTKHCNRTLQYRQTAQSSRRLYEPFLELHITMRKTETD